MPKQSEMEDLYLTNLQYVELLLKIQKVVNAPGFQPAFYDSIQIGDKYTESNCGFCNEGFTTKETAYFPAHFPSRKTMKYRQNHHRCPFDMGPAGILGWGSGCFYRCYLFQNEKHDVDLMRRMVSNLIEDGNFFEETEEGEHNG